MGSDAGNCYPQQTLCSLGTLKQLITEEQDTRFKTQGYLLLSMNFKTQLEESVHAEVGLSSDVQYIPEVISTQCLFASPGAAP